MNDSMSSVCLSEDNKEKRRKGEKDVEDGNGWKDETRQ